MGLLGSDPPPDVTGLLPLKIPTVNPALPPPLSATFTLVELLPPASEIVVITGSAMNCDGNIPMAPPELKRTVAVPLSLLANAITSLSTVSLVSAKIFTRPCAEALNVNPGIVMAEYAVAADENASDRMHV